MARLAHQEMTGQILIMPVVAVALARDYIASLTIPKDESYLKRHS